MTDVAIEPVALPARERGWARPAIGLVLLLFVPLTPMLRMLLPVDQMVVLLVPAVAVCALVGWMRGGRPLVAVLWTVLAVWVLWTFAASTGTFGALVGGWSLLLAAAFGATTAWNDAGQARPFLQRALAAIALALTVGATVAAIAPGGVTALQRTVATEIGVRHDTTIARWHAAKALPEWQELITKNPDATPLFEQLEAQMEAIPPLALIIYPALLALESLATLALAWALYHRLGRVRLGPPLAPLREFRFSDHLVWGLIAGLVIVVIPGLTPIDALGANLLVLFGTLYALRGIGIALWFLAPGRLVMALLIAFSVLFLNVVGVLALGLGLGDTWLDWRRRASRQKS